MVAHALIALILQRVGPETVNADLTVEKLFELTLELIAEVTRAEKPNSGILDTFMDLYEDLSLEQKRVALYFRLCQRLRAPDELESFYERSRERGIKFGTTLYGVALSAATQSPALFQKFSTRVLADMNSEGVEPSGQAGTALLRGSAICGKLDDAFRHFKDIEAA
jgi:hypothetical protein